LEVKKRLFLNVLEVGAIKELKAKVEDKKREDPIDV
jgi:hypothetical protein